MKKRIIFCVSLTTAFFLLPTITRARDYSANTGRFMTMDKIEGDQADPQSLHKYIYCEDNPVDNTDPSGHDIGDVVALGDMIGGLASFVSPVDNVALTRARALVHAQGTIWINIGFDDTVDFNTVKPKMDRSYDFLDHLLTQNCPQWGITWLGDVKKHYDWKRKPAPSGGNYTSADVDNSHGFGISGHSGGIPVLLTTHQILGGAARAGTSPGQAIVYNVNDSNNSTLAHETGHWAGYYNATDPDHHHSLDSINIMFTGGGDDRTYADEDYCKKVTALAR